MAAWQLRVVTTNGEGRLRVQAPSIVETAPAMRKLRRETALEVGGTITMTSTERED